MTFSSCRIGLLRKYNYFTIASIIFVFVIFAVNKCEAERSYKIVVMPFRDYTQMNMEEMVPDVLRSMFTQSGYFEPVDREIIYEKISTAIPSNIIKPDDVTKDAGGAWTVDQVDLLARLDTKIVKKFGRQLKADYVLKGNISLIGSTMRIDAELIGVKAKKTLGSISVEGSHEELSSGILKELSYKIIDFCRNLNAYDDALSIIGMYNQGQYTFEVSEKKLKQILSVTNDAVGIRASLMVLYLSKINKEENALIEDKVIEEGMKILTHLDQDFDENLLEIFSTSGINPFDEIARILSKRGENEKAIEVYRKAIRVYPMNIAGHYKELGFLYLKSGSEDKAIDAFGKSLDTNKGNYEVHFALVSIFEKRNQPDKVRKHLEECIR
ncbi:MAG: tetratricopeptide repeat protein, partial [Candidatus Scalindua sp.]